MTIEFRELDGTDSGAELIPGRNWFRNVQHRGIGCILSQVLSSKRVNLKKYKNRHKFPSSGAVIHAFEEMKQQFAHLANRRQKTLLN